MLESEIPPLSKQNSASEQTAASSSEQHDEVGSYFGTMYYETYLHLNMQEVRQNQGLCSLRLMLTEWLGMLSSPRYFINKNMTQTN
jgi:hypothetical protein